MPTKFTFLGMNEFKIDLANLPATLTSEASDLVREHAEDAGAFVRAAYGRHVLTGNLRKGVRVKKKAARKYGAVYKVESSAPHATIFERGTEVRHYITKKNRVRKLVGPMPAFNIFGPIMGRQRRLLGLDLWHLLRKHGLRVIGDL